MKHLWHAPMKLDARAAVLESLESRRLLAAQAYDWDDVTIKANGFVNGIVYSPAAPDVVYMHTDMGGAYRWDASAGAWRSMIDWAAWNDWSPQNMGVETLAVDPTDPNRVYMSVGTYMSPAAILRSTDQGRTWLRTQMNDPGYGTHYINANGNGSARNSGQRLVVDPNSPNILFYGTRDDGLWKSANHGQTWTNVSTFPTIGDTSGAGNDTGIVWVQFAPSSSSPGSASPIIYAGVVTLPGGNPRVFRSIDAGATWHALPGGQPTTTGFFPVRAVLSPDGASLYITYSYTDPSSGYPGPFSVTQGFVQKVTNPGSGSPQWSNITPPGVGSNWGFSAVEIDPGDPDTVYVSELGNYNPADRIWRSTNSGASWTAINPNANRDNSSAPYVNSLGVHWLGDFQIDPFNSNIAMFTTGMGIYRTTNLGSANPLWTFFNEGFEQSAVLELVSPNSGDAHLLSAIGDRDGYRHVDFTQSPAIGRHGQNNGLARGTSDDVDVAWDNANYLVRTVRQSPWVQYSVDNGVTWNWFSSTGSSGSGNGPNLVAISADGAKAIYEPGGSGRTRYATRTGSNWSGWTSTGITNQPANGAKIVAELVSGSQTFYAIAGNVVSRSTNGGASWTAMATTLNVSGTTWVRAVPGQAGHLIISRGNNGVWRSTNGGATWTQLGGGATVANMVGVGAGPAPGAYPAIFISGAVNGQPGFFRSDDQGASWTMISDLSNQFGYPTVIQGDPRVYGRLYVGTNGRGIQYADIHSGPTSLPAGWMTQDIGSPATAGSAGQASGTWELVGGGSGVAGAADSFRFAYQQISGDATIFARVIDVPLARPVLTNFNQTAAADAYIPAKAGIMIRASLAADSSNAFVALTPGSISGALFQARANTGGSTVVHGSTTAGVWPPYWVKLTRAGDIFTAFASPDGINWTQLGSPQLIPMGQSIYIGLATTSSDNAQVNISSFTNVSIITDSQAPSASQPRFHHQSAPNTLSFKFSEDVSASLDAGDLTVIPAGGGAAVPVQYVGFDPMTGIATFALPVPLADGNYEARLIAAGIEDPSGNALQQDLVHPFFSLIADANRDRTVDSTDLGILAAHWQQPGNYDDGDFNYDGFVDISDLSLLTQRWFTILPDPGASAPTSATLPRRVAAVSLRTRVSAPLLGNMREEDLLDRVRPVSASELPGASR